MLIATREQELASPLKTRWRQLTARIEVLGSAVVAFSGGVDSSLLAAAAWSALADRMLAVTFVSPIEVENDLEAAKMLAVELGFAHRLVEVDDLSDPDFTANPPQRCFMCKLKRFEQMQTIAKSEGFACLIEGSNADDLQEYRPGRKAALQCGVFSPLQELGFTKIEIRQLAKALMLPNWDKPSSPCLATRFPYYTRLTHNGLQMVSDAEEYLTGLGFSQVRVRFHDPIARIEVKPEEIERMTVKYAQVAVKLKSLGFQYVTLDLQGFRSGSLDEELS